MDDIGEGGGGGKSPEEPKTGGDPGREGRKDAPPPSPKRNGPAPGVFGAHVELISADKIDPVSVDWVWKGFLARKKVEFIAGVPTTGKTTIALDFAAKISCGGKWPDGSRAPVGDVLIWSGEDDWDDTIVPRLIACGANRARVHKVAVFVDGKGEKRAFDPAKDIETLTAAAKRLPKLVMVIVDPVVAVVSGDSHKNAEVRHDLARLVALAEQANCVVLGITHFTKNTSGQDPLERVIGSGAFGAVARLVMMTVRPDEPGGKSCLVIGKSNIGRGSGGYEYELKIKPLPDHGIEEAQYVEWGERVEGTAREILNEAEGVSTGKESKIDVAKAWLSGRLSGGPVDATSILFEAEAAKIAGITLERAKKKLGVKSEKDGPDGGWRWHLLPPVLPQVDGNVVDI
jgi:putative DNA primase/helicase